VVIEVWGFDGDGFEGVMDFVDEVL